MSSQLRSICKGFVYVFICMCINEAFASEYDFKIKYEWKQIEYKFVSDEDRLAAIANGTFDAGNIQPIDGQYTYDANTDSERVFITTPRFASTGIPATLGVVTSETRDENPIIDPYPSWSWQINPEECRNERIVSVFRVWADECNRLWVVDTGVVGGDFVCAPQILTFDLDTDELINKYEVPYAQYQNVSLYIAPTAEVEDNTCDENAWLYVADCDTPSLLVYSLALNDSWVVEDESFELDSDYSSLTIEGQAIEIADGIFSVTLSPVSDGDERKLHYHAFASLKESWVYTKDLKNSSNFETADSSSQLFNTYDYNRTRQSATEAADQKGNIYFPILVDNEIAKWNSSTEYTDSNFDIITNTSLPIYFPAGLKVLPNKAGDGEVLWVFDVTMERWILGNLNGSTTNFRLFEVALD